MFRDAVNSNLASQDYENIHLKNFAFFQKGLDHSCDQKFEIFLLFVFDKIGQEKVFGEAVGRKLAFLVYKNIDLR